MPLKIEKQTLWAAFSKTTTVSYLLTELWSFFRNQEEIPWSQKRTMLSLKWDEHMTPWWLKGLQGSCWGERYFFPLIRGAQEGAALPFAALHLKLWSGLWEDAVPDAAAAASERVDMGEAETITEMLNWSGALISLICWINSSDCLHPDCLNNEKNRHLLLVHRWSGVLRMNWSTEAALHGEHSVNTGSFAPLFSLSDFCSFGPHSSFWYMLI